MQMIFKALSGSSGQVPVTPIGGNRMYVLCSMGIACIYRASQTNRLRTASKMHAIPIERNTFDSHQRA